LGGEAFYDDPAEAVQLGNVGELDSVSKRTAGGDNGVFKGDAANANPKVNFSGP
jgi:hypothetical protein